MLCDNTEGWDGLRGKLKREEMYIYIYIYTHTHMYKMLTNFVALLYGRNQHNVVKQYSSN